LSVDEPPTLNVVARRAVERSARSAFIKERETRESARAFLDGAFNRRSLRKTEIGRRKASFASFSLAKSIDETPSELETFRALDRILSRLPGAVASVNRAASGDDSNASSAKRLGAQDRMIPIMPKRAQSDNSDRAKKQDF